MLQAKDVLLACIVSLSLICAHGQQQVSDIPPIAQGLQVINGTFCNPGEIYITFRPNVTPAMKQQFEKRFGVTPGGLAKQNLENKAVAYEYIVPVGTEEFWIGLLKEHPLVEAVRAAPYETASVGTSIVRDINKHYPFQIASSEALNQGPLRELVESFLRQKYVSKKAVIKILESDDNFLKVQVRDLRGEVIPNENYWEHIELLYTVFFVVNGKLKMNLVLDGAYAETLGKHPPKDDAFSSMEPKYYKQVSSYAQGLTTELMEYLSKQERHHD